MPYKKDLLPLQCFSFLLPASFPPCYSACCAIHYDFLLWSLTRLFFPSLFSLLSHYCIPISEAYIHFMLAFTTGFLFSLSPFLSSSCSWGLFCLSYFVCHLCWARLPRQCSDQPETVAAYMAFVMSCLYKGMGLRRDGTRNQEEQLCNLFLMPIHCSTVTSFPHLHHDLIPSG